jgi:hypothetical protein
MTWRRVNARSGIFFPDRGVIYVIFKVLVVPGPFFEALSPTFPEFPEFQGSGQMWGDFLGPEGFDLKFYT